MSAEKRGTEHDYGSELLDCREYRELHEPCSSDRSVTASSRSTVTFKKHHAAPAPPLSPSHAVEALKTNIAKHLLQSRSPVLSVPFVFFLRLAVCLVAHAWLVGSGRALVTMYAIAAALLSSVA